MELSTIIDPSIKSNKINKKTYVKIDIEESKFETDTKPVNEPVNESVNEPVNNPVNNPIGGDFLFVILITIFVWNFLGSIGAFAGFIRYMLLTDNCKEYFNPVVASTIGIIS